MGNQANIFLEKSLGMNFKKFISTKGQRIGSIYSPTTISHWLIEDLEEILKRIFTSQSFYSTLSEGRIAGHVRKPSDADVQLEKI